MPFPADFFDKFPNLAQLLQAKEEFPHMIERALQAAADDIRDSNKPAAAKRKVKIVVTMLPEADRNSARVSMDEPEVTVAKYAPVAAQMSLSDGSEGVEIYAQNTGQTTRGLGAEN